MNRDNRLTSLIDIFIIILTVTACVINFIWFYTEFYTDKPLTTTTSYVSTVVNPATGTQESFLQLKNYSNVNNTGKEVFEFSFTYYTDIYKNAVITEGVQIIVEKNEAGIDEEEVYYYNTYNGVSYASVPDLNRGTDQLVRYGTKDQKLEYGTAKLMLVEIDKKMYGVALDGTYTIVTKGFDLGKSTGNFFKAIFSDWGMFNQEENWNTYTENKYQYTFLDFFKSVKGSLINTSESYGDYTLSLVDLSKYFSLYEYDTESLQFIKTPRTTFNSAYFSVDCHNNRYGAVRANQSMFNMVANDSKFNISKSGDVEDYWQMKVLYVLGNKDFNYRKSTQGNDYYITLNAELINYLEGLENLLINVEIHTDLEDNAKIIGLDMYSLYGLKINNINIINDTGHAHDFHFLDYALWDTDTQVITYSDNITMHYSTNYINGGVL